ncbi:hypothetical protein FEM48_Zijuj04G0170800 [Ziziphus jujuba var. spinosa]|uniref:Pentatricopeptide repeat-containing protein n=1 Tax=Ziziphus jujuba var. spinosa TaxID=714518 RepID=A0A978VL37_ZIZJJ|nr:hypothetical protein FEM48_Zijuj04G0170800 [Ziziphus jujuba var. spinosa]
MERGSNGYGRGRGGIGGGYASGNGRGGGGRGRGFGHQQQQHHYQHQQQRREHSLRWTSGSSGSVHQQYGHVQHQNQNQQQQSGSWRWRSGDPMTQVEAVRSPIDSRAAGGGGGGHGRGRSGNPAATPAPVIQCQTPSSSPDDLDEVVVKKVLLELKEPVDAKRALGFFHWSAHSRFQQHGLQSYCILIHILVRAGLNLDARALLESIVKKNDGSSFRFSVVDSLISSYKVTASNPFVFDMLVQVYAKLRMFEIGFDVCCYLDEHGFTLNLSSFNILIHVVQKSDQFVLVWKIYEHMITRIYPNEETVRILISLLCKEGKLHECVDILDRIHGKRCSSSVIVNTNLILRVFEEGRIEESMVLLKRMLRKNMVLNTIAYSLIVNAKVKIGNLGSAYEMFEEMLKGGFQPNPFVYTLFIGIRCKEGRIEEANCMMQEMEKMGLEPYGDTYNFLLEGSAKAGSSEEMLMNYEKMIRGI